MFDFIVVGAGAAGCVLANRLSADPKNKVLLLEAGGPDKQGEIHMPLAFSKLFESEVDWNYKTEPEPSSANAQYYWPRGKVLGGSTSINAMIYMRGHRLNFDGWAKEGCEGWSFKDVLPYFKKAQNQERGADDYHAVGGPLNVADPRDPRPLTEAIIDACGQAGIPRNPDFNGAEQDGAGLYQLTQKKGKRCSTVVAYLKEVARRPNLTIKVRSQVKKLLFEGRRCTGVELLDGTAYRADREVVLCGGAVNSPQVLMLSGIGPADQLRQHGIDVFQDLSGVGNHLMDHPALAVTWYCTSKDTLDLAETLVQLGKYFIFKKGMLTANVAEGGAFVRTDPALEVPDLQYHFAPCFFLRHGLDNPEKVPGFTLAPVVVTPKSRGSIKLRSADPTDHPIIIGGYYSHPDDIEVMLKGLKLSRKIAAQSALDPWRGEECSPGEAAQSDEDLRRFILEKTQSLYHPTSTCKMGVGDDAVVDPALKVRGVEGLRVADASVMPTITNANTNAPTIMIGEKAADMILNE